MELKLTLKQLNLIEYECQLLRISKEQLYRIAPHLFEELPEPSTKPVEEVTTKASNYEEYEDTEYPYYGDGYDG